MKRALLSALTLLLTVLLPVGCAGTPAAGGSATTASSSAGERAASSGPSDSAGVESAALPAPGTLDLTSLSHYTHRAAAGASDVTVYKDIPYGSRKDRADEGEGYGKGGAANRHRSGQQFDLYLSAAVTPESPVLLFLHGGAWSAADDKDGAEYYYPVCHAARTGWLVLSMDYMLQADLLADPGADVYDGATFAVMERDVDAMVSRMSELLPSLGFTARRFAIAGASAGAHLAALYAWDQAAPEVMGLSLRHAMPVGFLASVGGPLDLSSERAVNWMVRFQAVNASSGRLFTGLTGASLPEKAITAVSAYSPLRQIGASSVPAIIAYSHLPAESDPYVPFGLSGDGIVESSSYDNVVAALAQAGVPYAAVNVEGPHCTIDGEWFFARMNEFRQYL